ncbi:MAG: hypothetical protein ACLPX9_08365 [Rhodomicrobium sp.]
MANLRLNRLSFWIFVALYLAIKIPLANYMMSHLNSQQDFLKPLDTALFVALAIAVGARLNDAGRKRWIAIGTMFFLMIVLPLALVFGYIATYPKPGGVIYSQQEFMDLLSMFSGVSAILLAALLIWVGTRSSRPALPVPDARVEPRF